MATFIHPRLVNDVFGDPGVYAELMFERRALLFDLGDLGPLSASALLRVSHIFVSHAHADHFSGFDRLLRLCLGRDKTIALFGPPGLADRVGHKLAGYSWNLVRNYEAELVFVVTEIHPGAQTTAARYRSGTGFQREPAPEGTAEAGIVWDEPALRVRAVALDHQIPSMAYAIEEKAHVNIWKNRLAERGWPVGPWLAELKRATLAGLPDGTPFRVWWRVGGALHETQVPLGTLKAEVLDIVPGRKIAYVVDAVFHEANAQRIADLAAGADILFIETPFLEADAAIAARKYHLTARQAGLLARRAGVRELVTFHYSPRYLGRADELRREARIAFSQGAAPDDPMRRAS